MPTTQTVSALVADIEALVADIEESLDNLGQLADELDEKNPDYSTYDEKRFTELESMQGPVASLVHALREQREEIGRMLGLGPVVEIALCDEDSGVEATLFVDGKPVPAELYPIDPGCDPSTYELQKDTISAACMAQLQQYYEAVAEQPWDGEGD